MEVTKIREKFARVIEVVGEDMETVRVGAAKPSIVENVIVDAYGGKMRLVELASISAPDPNQLVITPWDKSVVNPIAKAISDSDLKLSANVMGEFIRIVIPPLTEERRLDMVKLVHQKLESGKMLLRQARQDLKEEIEKQEGQAGISEDDVKRELEELDKEMVDFTGQLEAMAKAKETEVTKI